MCVCVRVCVRVHACVRLCVCAHEIVCMRDEDGSGVSRVQMNATAFLPNSKSGNGAKKTSFRLFSLPFSIIMCSH